MKITFVAYGHVNKSMKVKGKKIIVNQPYGHKRNNVFIKIYIIIYFFFGFRFTYHVNRME